MHIERLKRYFLQVILAWGACLLVVGCKSDGNQGSTNIKIDVKQEKLQAIMVSDDALAAFAEITHQGPLLDVIISPSASYSSIYSTDELNRLPVEIVSQETGAMHTTRIFIGLDGYYSDLTDGSFLTTLRFITSTESGDVMNHEDVPVYYKEPVKDDGLTIQIPEQISVFSNLQGEIAAQGFDIEYSGRYMNGYFKDDSDSYNQYDLEFEVSGNEGKGSLTLTGRRKAHYSANFTGYDFYEKTTLVLTTYAEDATRYNTVTVPVVVDLMQPETDYKLELMNKDDLVFIKQLDGNVSSLTFDVEHEGQELLLAANPEIEEMGVWLEYTEEKISENVSRVTLTLHHHTYDNDEFPLLASTIRLFTYQSDLSEYNFIDVPISIQEIKNYSLSPRVTSTKPGQTFRFYGRELTDTMQVKWNDTLVASRWVNKNIIEITPPLLTEGSATVSLMAEQGNVLKSFEVHLNAQGKFGNVDLPISAGTDKIVVDEKRAQFYLKESNGDVLVLDASGNHESSLLMRGVESIALSPDHSILASTNDCQVSHYLLDEGKNETPFGQLSYSCYYRYLEEMVPLNATQFFIADPDQHGEYSIYDTDYGFASTSMSSTGQYYRYIKGNQDNTFVALVSYSDPVMIKLYNGMTGSMESIETRQSGRAHYGRKTGLNAIGDRLFHDKHIYKRLSDGTWTHFGELPSDVWALSRDGDMAVTINDNSSQVQIFKLNANGTKYEFSHALVLSEKTSYFSGLQLSNDAQSVFLYWHEETGVLADVNTYLSVRTINP